MTHAASHLQLLGYEPGDCIFLRYIPSEGAAIKDEAVFPSIPTRKGYGAYVVVNGGGHRDADVSECRAIFYEHDDLEKSAQRDLWRSLRLPEPTFQVDSGDKSIHSYWVLTEPITVNLWRSLQADLLEFADADRSIKNPSRVMRLAGSVHQKTGQQAAIVSQSGRLYPYDKLRLAVPHKEKEKIRPLPLAPSGSIPPTPDVMPLRVILSKRSLEAIDQGTGEGGRNLSGFALACDLLGCAAHLDAMDIQHEGDAENFFREFCDRCNPPLGEVERAKIWRSASTSNPMPSLSLQAIENCITHWQNKQNRLTTNSKLIQKLPQKAVGMNELEPAVKLQGEPETKKSIPVGDEPSTKKSASDALLSIAKQASYFHTADKVAYADVRIEGNRHTYPIRSKSFRLWLTGQYYHHTGKSVGGQTLQDLLGTLEAIAIFEGETHEVHLRVAEHQGKTYVDLGSADWKAVEVDAAGWRLVSDSPVRFWRPDSLLPLPMPEEGGSLDELRELLNVDDNAWALISTFLLFCFCPGKTYPVLFLAACRGSGKSVAAEILKGLIDPGKAPLIQLQGDAHKLAVAASRRWVMAYDNVGSISAETSDNLCRIATGFGYSTRTLHTTDEETTFSVCCPQIITAIDNLVTRDDLADRVLTVNLPAIPDGKRLPQAELSAKIEAARPRILGTLLTALSQTLAALPSTKPNSLPRMADYALFAIASEKALGLESGEFREAFDESRERSREVVIDSSPVGAAIMGLMRDRLVWKGTATDLLTELRRFVCIDELKARDWPKKPNKLKAILNRLKPDLEAMGIRLIEDREAGSGRRIIVLEKALKVSSQSSQENIETLNQPDIKDSGCDDSVTIPSAFIVTAETVEPEGIQKSRDGCDDCDDKKTTLSNSTKNFDPEDEWAGIE
jgi:hypothetical protein